MEELRRREEFAEQLGGPERVERQHAGGRYTVRERIAKLADPGSFHELGKIAGSASYDARNDLEKLVPSNFVFGRARLDGRPVVIGGDDFTVRGGSADATIKGKHFQCEQMAKELRLPLVRIVEGSGGGGSVKTIETTGAPMFPACRAGSWWSTIWARCRGSRSASGRWRGSAPRTSPPRTTQSWSRTSPRSSWRARRWSNGSGRSSRRTSWAAGRSSFARARSTRRSTRKRTPSRARSASCPTCRPQSTTCRRAAP
jgi:hypothetical protein